MPSPGCRSLGPLVTLWMSVSERQHCEREHEVRTHAGSLHILLHSSCAGGLKEAQKAAMGAE